MNNTKQQTNHTITLFIKGLRPISEISFKDSAQNIADKSEKKKIKGNCLTFEQDAFSNDERK